MKKLIKVLGIIFIIAGLGGIFRKEVLSGILSLLLGISLIPEIYEKSKLKNIKTIQIVLPIVLFIIYSVTISNSTINKSMTDMANSNTLDIQRLSFYDDELEIDIKETKDILLYIYPANSDINQIKLYSTNSQIAKFDKNMQKSVNSFIYGKIEPIAEGQCEVYAISDKSESNKVKITVIDKERIENENRIKKEEEERIRKEEEEKAKKEEEERARKEAEERAKKEAEQKQATQKQNTNKNKENQSTNKNDSRTVYITPTGKRYHYLSTCGGKNSSATTLSRAISLGLTPCKKCAQ